MPSRGPQHGGSDSGEADPHRVLVIVELSLSSRAKAEKQRGRCYIMTELSGRGRGERMGSLSRAFFVLCRIVRDRVGSNCSTRTPCIPQNSNHSHVLQGCPFKRWHFYSNMSSKTNYFYGSKGQRLNGWVTSVDSRLGVFSEHIANSARDRFLIRPRHHKVLRECCYKLSFDVSCVIARPSKERHWTLPRRLKAHRNLNTELCLSS